MSVTAVTTAFLNGLDLHGADAVRKELALLVAAELDDDTTPRHAVPALTSRLVTLVGALESAPAANGRRVNADRLLADVLR